MTKFCESCHTANRDRAKYCRGCAGKFSGIRTAANVSAGPFHEGPPPRVARVPRIAQPVSIPIPIPIPAFAHARLPAATKNDVFVVPRTTEKRQLARQLTLPGGLDVPVVLMLMVVLLSIAAFVFWYWDRTVERSLAPSTDAASIHWQQSALPTAPPPEPATDPEPAIAPVAVAPTVEHQVEPAAPQQETRTETQAVAAAPVQLPVAAPEAQPSEARQQSVDPLQAAEPRIPAAQPSQVPARQALAAPPPARASAPQRDRSTTMSSATSHVVAAGGRPTARESVATDVPRSIRAEQARIDTPAPATRPTVPGPSGTARTAGGTTPCDRYNPFGEAICSSAGALGGPAPNASAAVGSGVSPGQVATGTTASKGTSASGNVAIANGAPPADPGGSGPSAGNGPSGGTGSAAASS